jgi:hypothetical protein
MWLRWAENMENITRRPDCIYAVNRRTKYFVTKKVAFLLFHGNTTCVYIVDCYMSVSGPCNVVGIATGYGLDGPRIESRWELDFPHLSRPVLRPTQPPVEWVPCLSRG